MAVRPKVAFFEFTSCEGCQLTVVDSLQTHPELLEAVEIVRFREAMSEKGDDYLLAFIEGSCTRPSDEAQLKAIREQSRRGRGPRRLRPSGRRQRHPQPPGSAGRPALCLRRQGRVVRHLPRPADLAP